MARPLVLIRGGGELGTGVAHGLHRAGLRVLVVDRPLPRALRLGVTFATAALQGRIQVAGVEAAHCGRLADLPRAWMRGWVPVWTGAEQDLPVDPLLIVDARMRRLTEPLSRIEEATVVVGIGPGFEAGGDVHYVIESNRGAHLGQVISHGQAEPHTGVPGDVMGQRERRVVRSSCAGAFVRLREPGDFVEVGDVVGSVLDQPVRAHLRGMIRGLKLSGVMVGEGHKVGDVDPRRDPALLTTMTDKAQAVGQAVVEVARRAGLLPSWTADRPASR